MKDHMSDITVRARRKPDLPARETALLWVGCNRSLGARMALTGAAMTALMGYRCFVSHGAGLWIAAVFAVIGLLIVLVGARLAMRRAPVIAADERVLVAGTPGSSRSAIPWELISGAEAVGAPKAGGALVVLSDAPEEALKHVAPAVRPSVRRLNEKLGLAGVLHIPGNMMDTPPEVVAMRIRDIIGAPGAAPETAGAARVPG